MAVIPGFIPSPSSNGFRVGPPFVHAHGPRHVLAASAAIALTVRRWEQQGGRRDLVYEIAMWGVPGGSYRWAAVQPCDELER
jgi:phosphatidylglycerol---prolipoprotein diacylglyceryl transferase